jgi:hypothetical protein
MKHLYHTLFILLLPIFAAAQASQTATFSPGKDNSIYQESANSNALGGNIFCGNTIVGAGYARRALLQFPLTFPGAGAVTVVSARLTLYCTKTIAGPISVSLHKLTANWGEGTSNAGSSADGTGVAPTTNDATWQESFYGVTPWATQGGNFVATASATTSVDVQDAAYTWTSAQLAADVQAWINNPATNFGWIVIGDEANVTTAKRFGSRENATPAFRPVLSVTYQQNPIPVVLGLFTAKEAATGVQLNWQTQQELNNAWFDVQHSTDGTRFSSIGRVAGAGNSTQPQTYQFMHQGIPVGNHFYRLAQTDVDGKINYSSIVQVSTRTGHFTIHISPNPVASVIQFKGSAWQKGNGYSITAANGAILLQGTLQGNSINVAGLAPGICILKLQLANGETLHARFIKQ